MKLSWNFYVLWIALCGVIALKSLLIREMAGGDWVRLGAYFGIMLAGSLAAAWGAWRLTKRQKATELAFLTVMTLLFLIETVRLYRDAMTLEG